MPCQDDWQAVCCSSDFSKTCRPTSKQPENHRWIEQGNGRHWKLSFSNVAGAVEDLVDGLQDIKNMNMDDIIQKFRDFGNALLHGADGALAQAANIVEMRNQLQLAEAEQRRFMLAETARSRTAKANT
jgi:hypothetical protein